MRMRDVINVLWHEPTYAEFELPDSFKYTPDQGWRTLQKFCFWILEKLKCHATGRAVSYIHHSLKHDVVLESVREQLTRLALNGHGGRGNEIVILIGTKNFCALKEQSFSPFNFSYDNSFCFAQGDCVQVLGCRVSIIPTMDGVLVVPKKWITKIDFEKGIK